MPRDLGRTGSDTRQERLRHMTAKNPLARYRVAVIATPNEVLIPGADVAARRMRFQRYSELGWVPPEARDPDGGEHDQYDKHSMHLGVFRRAKTAKKAKAKEWDLIASSRLVLGDRTALPTQELFPKEYKSLETEKSVEISRIVSMTPCRTERHLSALAQMRAMHLLGTSMGYRDYICIVHPRYLSALKRVGVPALQMAEPKLISEYGNSEDVPALIRDTEFRDAAKPWGGSGPLFFRTFMSAAQRTLGCGYFANGMVIRVG